MRWTLGGRKGRETMDEELKRELDELSTRRFVRKSKVIDGDLYLENDESLRRRIRGEPGDVEYRDRPE